MIARLAALLLMLCLLAGCDQTGPEPGATCSPTGDRTTAEGGTEMVCDEAGRWRRANWTVTS